MASLDVIMGKPQNKRKLEKALENAFHRDPFGFFKTVLMPLMPKESRLALEPQGVVRWQTLLGTTVTREELENAPRGALGPARRTLPEGEKRRG